MSSVRKAIGERIAEKAPEFYNLLQKIIDKPALYVGTTRFDYVQMYLNGFLHNRSVDWLPDKELQYWLLHRHSASLHSGSLQAYSLFYRLFGNGDMAFIHYKRFLAYASPEISILPGTELYDYEDAHETVRYEWEDGNPKEHHERVARSVVETAEALSGLPRDKLKIYIRRDRLFCQVRFLIHTPDGWRDDRDIVGKDESHDLLIALHANARNAVFHELRALGCEVFDSGDDSVFLPEYLLWKESVRESNLN